jgi:hypothetical protein
MFLKNIASWVQRYIEVSISDIPRDLELKLKQERHKLKERLKESNLHDHELIVNLI